MTRCLCIYIYIYIYISIPCSTEGEGEERTASGHLLLLEFRIGGFLAVIPVIKARSVIKEARRRGEPFSRRGIYLVFCTRRWDLNGRKPFDRSGSSVATVFLPVFLRTFDSNRTLLSVTNTNTRAYTRTRARVINAFHYCRNSQAFCSCSAFTLRALRVLAPRNGNSSPPITLLQPCHEWISLSLEPSELS